MVRPPPVVARPVAAPNTDEPENVTAELIAAQIALNSRRFNRSFVNNGCLSFPDPYLAILHHRTNVDVRATHLPKDEKWSPLPLLRLGKASASRTMGMLGAIFAYAVKHKMRLDNPVRGVQRFPDVTRNRRL